MTTTTQPEEIASEDLSDSLNTTMMRRILASSFLGSMIEFYDFILFATAASIVFSQVYFVDLDPGLGLFLSFTILAVGYVARPIGGIGFGHFGDMIGSKGVRVTSMMLMGGTTVAIGLLPPTATIGVAAPILLTVFRVIQGLAVGGEWGGAMLIALEHSPKKRRGFAASFANMGGPAGAVLATVVMSVFTLLPDEQFISWGWRIPFLLSAVLVFIGLIIRMKVHESPIFQKLQDKADERKVPLLEVISKYPKNLILGIIAGMSSYTVQGLMTVWGISYVINSGLDSTHVLWVKALGAASTVVVVWFASQLSDRFGRRPVMIVGMFIGAVAAFPVMFMLDMSNLWVFAMALLITQGLVQGTIFGPFGAFAAEMFPTHIRYTGASLVYQTSSTLGAGFTPMIASSLVAIAGGSLWLIAVVWIAVFLIAILAISFVKEGRTADLEGDMR
ncbi:MAG: MHS family MFS transporter [Yaniella sp.]|nr:MHS family MFS transporter [Yaniella sp.]